MDEKYRGNRLSEKLIQAACRQAVNDGFKRYEVENFINNEVLELCEKLCDCKFESIKKMLSDNVFYGRIFK